MPFKILVLLLFIVSSVLGQSQTEDKYFRHLRYNHISPYADLIGIHPISEADAHSSSHYIFKYDKTGKLLEITNNHYHTEKKHPLASIGVYKLKISYEDNKEIRIFYDPNGKRISNDRNVYKEVFHYDGNQQKSELYFYDDSDEPMESNWAIAKYTWERRENQIIERRFNLEGKAMPVSPYFDFGITAIRLNNKGLPTEHYNLNDQLQVSNNAVGIASYKDEFDELGNHIKYSYYDEQDKLALNQWRFAIGVKSYDHIGNQILLEQLDTEGNQLRSREVPSNANIEMSSIATSQDSSEIRRQSLGYLKALQQMDPQLMDQVLNDSLNKISIGYNREVKKEIARATTRNQMMAFAEDWNKSNTKFPPIPNDEVIILGIYDRIASVQLNSDNWVEYLHLINLNGEWKIINLIWQHKDINRYPK